MREVVVWQDGQPKCRFINCVPTLEERQALRRGGCEIRANGKKLAKIAQGGEYAK